MLKKYFIAISTSEISILFPLTISQCKNFNISFIIVHANPLGFGGPLRPGEQLGWAQNQNRDWPHGTGPIPVQPYMAKTNLPQSVTSIKTVQEVIAELDAQREAQGLGLADAADETE